MSVAPSAVLRSRGLRLTTWYVVAVTSVVLTFLAGPFVQFPVAFVLPVVLAAWFDGPRHAVLFAVALPMTRFAFVFGLWTVPWNDAYSAVNAVIRMSVLTLLAVLTSRVAAQHRALQREVTLLEKILPICTFCKKIRDQDETWTPLESYFRARGDLSFSHGMCPDCAREHFPEYFPRP